MALAALIVSGAGLILSFILGFPWSMVIGPPIGLVFSAVGFVLAIAAGKNKKKKLKMWALIVSGAVLAVSAVRFTSLFTCAGRISGLINGLII